MYNAVLTTKGNKLLKYNYLQLAAIIIKIKNK